MKVLKLFLLLTASVAFGQIGTTTTNRIGGAESKWVFGGGVGIGFSAGSYGTGTTIGISPRVGYLVTDNLDMGVSAGFTWGNNSYVSSAMFNVGPYANYYISRSFYLSGMYQHYFFNQKDKYYNYTYSDNEAALYIGGGYMQRVGNSAYMQFGAMYNVLYKSSNSIFSTGFVPSVGVVFGL